MLTSDEPPGTVTVASGRSKGKSQAPNGLEGKPTPLSLGSVEYRIRWGEHAGRIKCGVVKSDGGIETKEGLYFSNIRSWVRSGPFHCPQGSEGCRDSQNTSSSRIALMVEVRETQSLTLELNGCRPLGYIIYDVCAREILAVFYLLTQ